MVENIKKRIVHFYTHGNIIEDFVEARRKKTAKLRRVIRACFYIQCALAVCCIAAALLMGAAGAYAIIAGSIAVCVVAFISLGGGTVEKTILYILDLAYAVICFIVGGLIGSSAFMVCGALMLLSAAVALGGFFAAWCRQYLLDFSPARITRADYTPLTPYDSADAARQSAAPVQSAPAPPPPPPKTEMEMLAEKLSDILGSIPDVKSVSHTAAARESRADTPSAASAEHPGENKPVPPQSDETNNSAEAVLSSAASAAVTDRNAEAPSVKPDTITAYDIKAENDDAPSPKADTRSEFNVVSSGAEAAEVLPADLSIDG